MIIGYYGVNPIKEDSSLHKYVWNSCGVKREIKYNKFSIKNDKITHKILDGVLPSNIFLECKLK